MNSPRPAAVFFSLLGLFLAHPLAAQETRSVIFGTVSDFTGGAIPGATVVVVNVETNVTLPLTTNNTGYYEAQLLLAGRYRVTVELGGFKKAVRQGIVLPVSSRVQVDVRLEIGSLAETVTVTVEAPLLETNALSAGRVFDNRTLRDLPTLNNNSTLLIGQTVGVQARTQGYTNPAFTFLGEGNTFNTNGNVGGNDFTIDGVPNHADRRRVAFQPHPDTLQEFKVETANFDASKGATSGISVSMMTKSGTNEYHGSLSHQHWRSYWNAVPYFVERTYFAGIAAASAAGDTARADFLRAQYIVPPAQSNNYAYTLGGPVRLPRFDGRNRLFFFGSFNGLNDRMWRTGYGYRTVPSMAHRQGDFSDLLRIDPIRYQIYDPLTVRPDPSRPGHFIRDPFPGNIIPQGRWNNPLYQPYLKFLPPPNNSLIGPRDEPSGNFVTLVPWRFDYRAASGRIDYVASKTQRFFGRFLYSRNEEHNQDWLYSFSPGIGEAIGLRRNIGGTLDWVWTKSSRTVINATASGHEFMEQNFLGDALKIRPSSVGLPGYIDQFAEARGKFYLPTVNVAGYDRIGDWGWQGNLPKLHQIFSGKADVTHVRGAHTLRSGLDIRRNYKHIDNPGETSGWFNFDNFLTRRNDDALTPAANLGLGWAAFMLGLPSNMFITVNDHAVVQNGYFGGFAQDTWRVSPKLTVNVGLRLEYETGGVERLDRVIGGFDPDAVLPISAAAEAAYARQPLPELPAGQLKIRGGSTYPGKNGLPRELYQGELLWLPRVSAAYQLGDRSVLRGGYGIYYDSLNVIDFTANFPSQLGYSRSTSPPITNDFGTTFLVGNPYGGVSPLVDPFPLRADGTRFDEPVRDQLGLMAVNGRSFAFVPYDIQRARQQRWRASFQRQLGAKTVAEAAYAGSYSDRVYISKNLNPLPKQYWADGLLRNTAPADDLNRNVSNPLFLGNFEVLRTSNPLVYDDMSRNSFFLSTTIRKHQLLRPYPNMAGLFNDYAPDGRRRTHAIELSVDRRLARGLSANLAYTRLWGRDADFFANEFDDKPTWRETNNGRPHRLTISSIVELPFGRERRFLSDGILGAMLGGFQASVMYEYQTGALLDFPNLFYYGDLADIRLDNPTPDLWFNTDNFERVAAKGPAAFHRRVFPTRVAGVRGDSTNLWNVNLLREFTLRGRLKLDARLDVLNLFNDTLFANPSTDPYSTNFGKVTTDSGVQHRFIQVQARLRF